MRGINSRDGGEGGIGGSKFRLVSRFSSALSPAALSRTQRVLPRQREFREDQKTTRTHP